MKKLIVGLFVSVTVMITASTASARDGFDLEKTKQVLEGEIQKALGRGTASISIALVRGDEIVWKAAYGYMNVRMKVPATPETIYVTGSTFKAVTATAVLQLVERRKLALDDPVNQYLGNSKIRDLAKNPVTFRHLLCHASGLNPGANTVKVWDRELPMTLEALIGELRAVRPPGKRFEYNNYGYGVAGLLVERVTGVPYEQYIVENILQPLGVETRGPVEPTPEMVERMALPYVEGPAGQPRPVPQTRYDVFPAGDIYLTAEDMARFLGAHLNEGVFNGNRILSKRAVKEAHKIQCSQYGLGWFISNSAGRTIIQHGGGVEGFRATMIGDLDARVGAYIMSNSGNVEQIGIAAIQLLRGEDYVPAKERQEIQLEAGVLDRYLGKYKLRSGAIITVTRVENQLYVQATGQPRVKIYPESEAAFFCRVVDAQITFEKNQKGEVRRLILHQDGTKQPANKLE